MSDGKELPPLRIRIVADGKSLDAIVNSATKSAEALSATLSKMAKASTDDFNRQFNNYRLLEKSKQIMFDREVFNIQALEKSKAKAFERDFQNAQLLEKAKKNAMDKEIRNYELLEKSKAKAFERDFQNAQLLEKAKNSAFEREFRNYALLEKSKAIQAAAAAAQEAVLEANRKSARQARWQADRASGLSTQARIAAEDKANAALHKSLMARLAEYKKAKRAEVAAANQAIAELTRKQTAFENIRRGMQKLAADADKKHAAESKAAHTASMKARLDYFNLLSAAQAKLAKQEADAAKAMLRHMENIAKAVARNRERALGRGSKEGKSGSNLGDRADIYMGMSAMRETAGIAAAPLAAAMNWQQSKAAMTGMLGSADAAEQMMLSLRKLGLETPYTSAGLAESAKQMLSYGMSSEQTLKQLEQLGNIAAGDDNKLHLLAYAMAQITSQGKLAGQELRQLTEHGFNPLQIIAEKTVKAGQSVTQRFTELKQAMSEGRISAEAVAAALDVHTSAGGRMAGMNQRLNAQTKGLFNQIKELRDVIYQKVMDPLLEEINRILRVAIKYLKAMSDWVDKNKELASTYAKVALYVLGAIITIQAMAVAIAILRWQTSQFGRVSALVWGGFTVLMRTAQAAFTVYALVMRYGLIGLQVAFRRTALYAVVMWFATLGPIPWIIAGIAAVGAAVLGLYAVFGHPGGVKAFANDFMAGTMKMYGFFFNFSQNIKILIDWIGVKWTTLWGALNKYTLGLLNGLVNAFKWMGTAWIKTLDLLGKYTFGWVNTTYNMFKWLVGSISGLWDRVPSGLKNILLFQAAPAAFLAGNAISGMTNGIKGGPKFNLDLPKPEGTAEAEKALKEAGAVDWDKLLNVGGKGSGSIKPVSINSGYGAGMYERFTTGSLSSASTAGQDKLVITNNYLRQIAMNTKEPMKITNANLTGEA